MIIDKKNKKVLFICSRHGAYTRNEFIINLLNNKYDTDIIFSNNKYYFNRIIIVLWKFIFTKNKNKYNFIFIGFFAQILIPFIKIFYKKKIVADFFISIYDTLCVDRKKISAKSIFGKLIFLYEKWVLHAVDLIIVDTEENKKYFYEQFNVKLDKIKIIYVLANKKLFNPEINYKITAKNKYFQIFFYADCQKMHGVDIILKSAKLLENKNIFFTLIGPIKNQHNILIKKLNLINIKFIDWARYKDLSKYISVANVCLGGHFGNTNKARRVIAGKTFQFAVMRKPIIIGDNNANKEIFTNEKDCLIIKMNDEKELNRAIMKLYNNRQLRKKIATNAYNTILTLEQKYKKITF